ncbi:MAG: response regulator, partial [Gallionellaceae bacterium]|nr:response regulator [Gallionellaceae bacterium]
MVRVLVVEDNPVNMKLALLLLHKAGHAVQCAVDAEAGLILARADRPDLILMDIQLPGMDGLAATELLKQDAATAAIPVIALTAMATKADHEMSRAAGCAAYITKPLRYQELYAAIDTVLGVKSLHLPRKAELSDDTSIQQLQGDASSRVTDSDPVDVSVLEGLIGNDP